MGASSNHAAPSAKPSAAARATSAATRVFPLPPAPVSVTSLATVSASATAATSRSRPTNDVSGAGTAAAGGTSVIDGAVIGRTTSDLGVTGVNEPDPSGRLDTGKLNAGIELGILAPRAKQAGAPIKWRWFGQGSRR